MDGLVLNPLRASRLGKKSGDTYDLFYETDKKTAKLPLFLSYAARWTAGR